ncbi:MAG: eukaryotic translation initiation factor, partial [Mucilaginibacter sp.]|nr:eukaryotic translation initiation factor [Mucilaginibacter sp.]
KLRAMGIAIESKPSVPGVRARLNHPSPGDINAAFRGFKGKMDLIFVILVKKDTQTYNTIKTVTDTELGMPTVCMSQKKLCDEKGQPMYFANVGLKVNLKFGGINHSLKDSHSVIKSGKTMVVGYDVTHPTNMGPSKMKDKEGNPILPPSMVGLVASVDKELAQWPAEAWNNPGGTEVLDERLILGFKNRLELWRKHNNRTLPENIVIYRDGVSEGQFKIVLEKEIPHIRTACNQMYGTGKRPRITLMVSVKRHQTRFYPTDADRSSQKSPKSGTVVDRGVTNARYWDFFLQAHTAIKGKPYCLPLGRFVR